MVFLNSAVGNEGDFSYHYDRYKLTQERRAALVNQAWDWEDIQELQMCYERIAEAMTTYAPDDSYRTAWQFAHHVLPPLLEKHNAQMPEEVRKDIEKIRVNIKKRMTSLIDDIEKDDREMFELAQVTDGRESDAYTFYSSLRSINEKIVRLHQLSSCLGKHKESDQLFDTHDKLFRLYDIFRKQTGLHNPKPLSEKQAREYIDLLADYIHDYKMTVLELETEHV